MCIGEKKSIMPAYARSVTPTSRPLFALTNCGSSGVPNFAGVDGIASSSSYVSSCTSFLLSHKRYSKCWRQYNNNRAHRQYENNGSRRYYLPGVRWCDRRLQAGVFIGTANKMAWAMPCAGIGAAENSRRKPRLSRERASNMWRGHNLARARQRIKEASARAKPLGGARACVRVRRRASRWLRPVGGITGRGWRQNRLFEAKMAIKAGARCGGVIFNNVLFAYQAAQLIFICNHDWRLARAEHRRLAKWRARASAGNVARPRMASHRASA